MWGPTASAVSLPVAETVSGPAGVPTISPSATSPQLTVAADDGCFFRTALSDTAQGPVLARLTGERGFDNVGLLYIDDPYGQGLARSFEDSWEGALRAVAVGRDQTAHLAALRASAGSGAQALVVITFEDQALSIVREALEVGIYSHFVFGAAAKRRSLVTEIGGERMGGMYGTAGAPAPAARRGPPRGRRLTRPNTALRSGPPTSRRPTTRPSRWLCPPRRPAASKATPTATTCEPWAVSRGSRSWELPRESPSAFACLPMAVE